MAKDAASKTVKLPVKVIAGAKEYLPGEDIPLTKDFTEDDVKNIEAAHGKFDSGEKRPSPSDARVEAAVAAKVEENTLLRAVIAAYEEADAAAVKAGAEGATEDDVKALDAAVARVAEARKAAKL